MNCLSNFIWRLEVVYYYYATVKLSPRLAWHMSQSLVEMYKVADYSAKDAVLEDLSYWDWS